MNIMVISDQVSKRLWDNFDPNRLKGIDLILSCGDLPPQYLSMIATFTHAPVLYVHGNHDDCYENTPPEGCICIDGRIYRHEGIRILGIGGSMRYKDGEHMFTEHEMRGIVRHLWWQLFINKGFDIMLTHSPAYQLGDDTDLPHTGFKVFRKLLDKYQPRYMIHGHVHMSYGMIPRVREHGQTMLINGYECYCFEYETGKRINR